MKKPWFILPLSLFLFVSCQSQVPVLLATSPADTATPTVDIHCSESDPNPIGQDIASTYNVSYEQVMTWFCQGYSFDNIIIALETSEATEIPAETLLQMLLEKDWETIWQEIGFVASP